MKTIYSVLLALICACTVSAQSFDLKDVLKGIGGSSQSSESSESGKSGSGLGDVLGSVIGNVLGTSKITPADLTGTWNYSAPAVAFKSDDLLKKAGGAVASATIESKIAPYYKRAGLDNMVFTVNADSTFTMKFNRGSLSGTLAQSDQEGFMKFQFKAMGKMNVGSLNAAVTKAGNQLSITFDISKLMSLVNTIASISGNSTLKGANSLLQSYDGMQAGFRLKKVQ